MSQYVPLSTSPSEARTRPGSWASAPSLLSARCQRYVLVIRGWLASPKRESPSDRGNAVEIEAALIRGSRW